MKEVNLSIGYIYPELLNLYGDRGNILALSKRSKWRNIETSVHKIKIDDEIDFKSLDIVYLGAGQESSQELVYNKLKEYREELIDYIEDKGVLLAIDGSYTMLGKKDIFNNQEVEALSILDIYTEKKEKRYTGNIIIETKFNEGYNIIVGFENHNKRTYINNNKPLGYVKYGNGNNELDKTEGLIYKNLIGTYIHGPLLPKNPELTDYIISKALKRKYPEETIQLDTINDTIENKAKETMIKRLLKQENSSVT